MKKILIIGGSKGIGNAILLQQLESNTVYTISRNAPEITHPNLTHFSLDVLQDTLPEIESLDSVIYCPGSITLKPIGSLSIDDFRNDFEINVIGAVKVIQKYLPNLKKGTNPSIVLFSSVASIYTPTIARSPMSADGRRTDVGLKPKSATDGIVRYTYSGGL